MSRPVIVAAGGYAPHRRLPSDAFADVWGRHHTSGIESVAVPDADEDALTMAWEAATRALEAAGRDAAMVAHLGFATTTPPLEEEDLSVRLGSTLGVGEHATHAYHTGSTRAGTRAIRGALEHGPWGDDIGLVVAADAPEGFADDALGQGAGAGAAAVVLASDGPAEIVATGEGTYVAPGERFRRRGSTRTEGLDITSYDRSAYSRAIERALDDLTADVGTVGAVAVYAPDGKRPYRVASSLGVDSEVIRAGTTVHELGDTGAAGVPLGLVKALDDGAGSVLAVGYGSGAGADALLVDASAVPTQVDLGGNITVDYADHLRRRGWLTAGPPEGGGAYVSLPTWRRSLPQRHRLEAGLCRACGELAFPPEGACPACAERDGYDAVSLTGGGTIEAVSTIAAGGAPPEFDEQQSRSGEITIAIVAFDGPDGGQVSVPVQVADTDDSPAVGDRVTSIIRLLYTQEGVPRYARKVRPAD